MREGAIHTVNVYSVSGQINGSLSQNPPGPEPRIRIYVRLSNRVQRLVMKTLIQKFWADETAATAIEYGLIAAGIALAIIAVVNGIGGKLNTKFSSINTSLK